MKIVEEFKNVAKIYLSSSAKPLDIEEYIFRGCKCWIFRRDVRKWRPTSTGLHRWRNAYKTENAYDYNKIPEHEREYYQNEFWMGISDYFTKYNVEFEETVEKTISESQDREEAKFRLEYFITEHYAEHISMELIP